MKKIKWATGITLFSILSVGYAYDFCHETGLDNCTLHSRPVMACQDQVYGALPEDQANEIKICHNAYLTAANVNTKGPDWVAYHLTASHLELPLARGFSKRVDYFCPDPCLPAGQRSEEADYNGLYPAFNRGHMDPAADNSWDRDNAYKESYFYSNMLPQLPANNAGIWEALEHDVDVWAKIHGELYVIDGPIYDYQGVTHQVVGKDGVWAPAAFYKIIYDPKINEALAFIIPNQNINPTNLSNYIVSIDEVNTEAKLNLFNDLSASVKSQRLVMWPFS